MATPLLNLPVNIPWKQIATSPDMMDTRLFNERFPHEWRSSLAISAYEPSPEELPEEICDELITYFKVTCTITGYQPSSEETREGYTSFPDIPREKLDRIFEEYFACYGVLLNVAVFPYNPIGRFLDQETPLKDYPHIISIEPKQRDLYQAATENGEILTASNSKVTTDKSFSHTESSETGLSLTGGYKGEGGGNIQGTLSHKWGSTDKDSKSIQTDASRERRETEGTSTQISQMYNLLTGYHQGTNRAVFLMLPRPHTLQPTDHRTFIQGLRQIEGIQEFVLIVSRPKKVKALCIEAFLETGHFPENVTIEEPEQEFETRRVEVAIGPIRVSNGGIFNPGRNEKSFQEERSGFEVDGWKFDPTSGFPGRGGIEELRHLDGDNADGSTNGPTGGKPAMEDYTFRNEIPDKVVVSGKLRSRFTSDTVFHRLYSVFLRRPVISSGEPSADVTKLLITSRGLVSCLQKVEGCIKTLPSPLLIGDLPDEVANFKESIVDERKITLPPSLINRSAFQESRSPAVKELLNKIKTALSTSYRLPSRQPLGEIGFLDSNYFRDKILEAMPIELKQKRISEIKELPADVVKNLGDESTVNEVLQMNLTELGRNAGIKPEAAREIRRKLLGFKSTISEK